MIQANSLILFLGHSCIEMLFVTLYLLYYELKSVSNFIIYLILLTLVYGLDLLQEKSRFLSSEHLNCIALCEGDTL